jgi:hypothetical protein
VGIAASSSEDGPTRTGRPSLDDSPVALVVRMARENLLVIDERHLRGVLVARR